MKSLRLIWEHARNVPGLGRDIAALAVIVAIGLASVGYMLAQAGIVAPWADRYEFSADFEEASGVRPESLQEVRIAGVTVGKIIAAQPRPDGKARVTMSLEPGHQVYDNARAVLRSKAPINVVYVALNPGGPPGKPLAAGGTLPVTQTERPLQPSELLNNFDERTRNAATSLIDQSDIALANAPQHLPKALQATASALDAVKPVVQSLQTRRKTISRLVTSLAQISKAAGGDNERLARLTSSLQEALAVLDRRDKQLGKTLEQLPGFNSDLTRAMTETGELTTQLDPALDGLHRAAHRLPKALSRMRGSVEAAGKLIEAARPVVRKAEPVVADLRPLSRDLGSALGDFAPVTAHLPSATKRIVPWMDDLAAFVYQTSSAFSISDANGGLGRANITVDVMNPTGGLGPITQNGGPK